MICNESYKFKINFLVLNLIDFYPSTGYKMTSAQEKCLRKQFILFSGLNKTIALPQLNKWFKQAEIFDGPITHSEVEKVFSRARYVFRSN